MKESTRQLLARAVDTIEAAVTAAETGHLVFGTLHTTGCQGTINRIIDAFPQNQQAQIRVQLSVALIGVISQALCPRKPKGMVAAYEFMMVTSAIANLIRENKTFRIDSAIQTGKKYGMQLLDEHLYTLWSKDIIDEEDAIDKAKEPGEMAEKIEAKKRGVAPSLTGAAAKFEQQAIEKEMDKDKEDKAE